MRGDESPRFGLWDDAYKRLGLRLGGYGLHVTLLVLFYTRSFNTITLFSLNTLLLYEDQ